MMKNPIIKLNQLSKSYKTKFVITKALDGINMEINEGEFVSLTGPSGCGKSTLLSIVGLLNHQSEGTYFLSGIDVSELNAGQKSNIRNKHIGFIFQSFNLIDELTALENVILPITFSKKVSKESKDYAEKLLSQVGLEKRINHFPSELSGGQQQRVAIARSLINKPQIILADEPTGNLDSKSSSQIMKILSELHNKGQTILMVTHEEESTKCASRNIELKDGKIVSCSQS